MKKALLNSHAKAISPDQMPKSNSPRMMWRCSTEIARELNKVAVEGHYIPMYLPENAKYFAEHSYQSATFVARENFGFISSEEEELWDRMEYGSSLSSPIRLEQWEFEQDVQKVMCRCLNLKDYETAYLLFFTEYSIKQVASILELPLKTVYSRYYKIAKLLKKHYYEAH